MTIPDGQADSDPSRFDVAQQDHRETPVQRDRRPGVAGREARRRWRLVKLRNRGSGAVDGGGDGQEDQQFPDDRDHDHQRLAPPAQPQPKNHDGHRGHGESDEGVGHHAADVCQSVQSRRPMLDGPRTGPGVRLG